MAHEKLLEQLQAVASMPAGEITSRKAAIEEIKRAVLGAITVIQAFGPGGKQSSPEMSTLAAEVLNRTGEHGDISTDTPTDVNWCWVLSAARSLAGSVMSQDQTPGQGEAVEAPEATAEEIAERALVDAQQGGQAHPIVATVPVDSQQADDNGPVHDPGEYQ